MDLLQWETRYEITFFFTISFRVSLTSLTNFLLKVFMSNLSLGVAHKGSKVTEGEDRKTYNMLQIQLNYSSRTTHETIMLKVE